MGDRREVGQPRCTGIFGFRLGPIECVELVAIWIVYPSGALFATMSLPIVPPAPGRFSTTTCCFSRSDR